MAELLSYIMGNFVSLISLDILLASCYNRSMITTNPNKGSNMKTTIEQSITKTLIGALIVATFLFSISARAEDNVQDLIDIAETNCGIILNEKINLTVASDGKLGLTGEYFYNPNKAYNECVEESVGAIYESFGISTK